MKALSYHPVAKWIIGLILLLGLFFFHEFIVPALGATIIIFVTWKAYTELLHLCQGNGLVASTLATLFVVLVIIIPFLWLAHYLFHELQLLIAWVTELNRFGKATPQWIQNLPLVGEQLNFWWETFLTKPNGVNDLLARAGLRNIFAYSVTITKEVTRHFTGLGFTLLFMMLTLFFLYKDGPKLAKEIDTVGEKVFPDRWQRISRIVPALVSSTVIGMIVIAIGEGIVFGFVYYFVGAPSPFTLGVVTGIFALVPGGAPFSMTMVSLYLVGSGSPISGIILFCWGTVQLFVVDKTIRPHLVGGAVKLPILPTIIGLVGGIKTMGLIGLFIGPVIMALMVTLWREWVHEEEHKIPEAEPKRRFKKISSQESGKEEGSGG